MKMLACYCLSCVLFLQTLSVSGQDVSFSDIDKSVASFDTNFIESYAEQFIGRLYGSRKYTNSYWVLDEDNLRLQPNSTYNIGIGATWKGVTLNIAYGFPFAPWYEAKGKTKYLDLQTHMYKRNWVIDAYGQFYKGYHTKSIVPNVPYNYYADLKHYQIGLSAYRLSNGERYSMAAAYVQTERQLQSAGSWLWGLEAAWNFVDQSLALNPPFQHLDWTLTKVNNWALGPGFGYGYNFVFLKYFFLAPHVTISPQLVYQKTQFVEVTGIDLPVLVGKWGVGYAVNSRLAIGINKPTWELVAFWTNRWAASIDPISNPNYNEGIERINFNVGNYRLIFVKRMETPKVLKNLEKRFHF
jgi:hypothetical protein